MYGYHFNKKLCEHAVSGMEKRTGEKLEPWDKQRVENLLTTNGVKLERNVGYDAVYVANMARADYYGSSIVDEMHLAKYLKDYLDDIDGSPTRAFDEYFIKTVAMGEPIFWEDMM